MLKLLPDIITAASNSGSTMFATHGQTVIAEDFTEVWIKKEAFELRPCYPPECSSTSGIIQREILSMRNEVRGE
jgi:hypothetical protein